MTKLEKKTSRVKFSSNQFIVAGLVIIFVWLIVTNVWGANLSNSNSLLLKLPIIFGSFSLAYGLGIRLNDKLGTITVTVLIGVLFSCIFSIPLTTYANFIRYFF